MAKKKNDKHVDLPPLLTVLWVKGQFDQLRRDHAIILEKLDDLHKEHLLILAKLEQPPPQPKPQFRFDYSVGPVVKKKPKRSSMLEITITNEQQVKVHLTPVTEGGKPAPIDGVPEWSVVAGDSTFVAAPDGMSADLISADDPGDTQFLVKADADIGEGVEEISDIIKLSVAGASAKNLGLSADAPVQKPTAAPTKR